MAGASVPGGRAEPTSEPSWPRERERAGGGVGTSLGVWAVALDARCMEPSEAAEAPANVRTNCLRCIRRGHTHQARRTDDDSYVLGAPGWSRRVGILLARQRVAAMYAARRKQEPGTRHE